MESVCNIEIIKDGEEFVVRMQLANGEIKEYRRENLEELLTEMVIALQDELDE
ncbi:MAG: hypothetical protein JSW60_04500 [Thermoplasmatales archaeon]|nr:MAG: hypothetical protein JSW60_04500 [Thermoplasmatales archaeon]